MTAKKINLRYYREDSGYCRVYYKSKANYLYCMQEITHDIYGLFSCSRDGEPDSEIPVEAIETIEMAKGDTKTETGLNKFLLQIGLITDPIGEYAEKA